MLRLLVVCGSSFVLAMRSAMIMATSVSFVNDCTHNINLYDNDAVETIVVSRAITRELANGFSGMFRNGTSAEATLAQFAINGGKSWYAISTVPPRAGTCTSYADCAAATGKSGYNVAMSIIPDIGNMAVNLECVAVTCTSADCDDAYLYPTDYTKQRNCPDDISFKVTFCPNGLSDTPMVSMQTPTEPRLSVTDAPVVTTTTPMDGNAVSNTDITTHLSTLTHASANNSSTTTRKSCTGSVKKANIRSSFAYTGTNAGSTRGTYGRVTEMVSCTKESVSVADSVGPLSEEVSMVFRGPMDIHHIAVFSSSPGRAWTKVSSYDASAGTQHNMVFMNNLNIEYTGANSSPQGYSTADGKAVATESTIFGGYLADASDSSVIGGGPCVSTGCEVNIVTSASCAEQEGCIGYYDDMGFHGWNGGMKMFVTKVRMPPGDSVSLPAIWMLNAQVVRANQYGCNCRGWGAMGGCGELDIAEVIETNTEKNKVSTHYYFYDGSVSPGGDNFATRPTDSSVTYVTIIDNSGEGVVKIIEIGGDDFDFSVESVSADTVSAWLSAPVKNLFS